MEKRRSEASEIAEKEHVIVDKGRVRLNISPAIYDYFSIIKTREIFPKNLKISVKRDEHMLQVTIQPKVSMSRKELEIIGYEFFNHLLNTTKDVMTG
jgi:hypothetical protein